MSNKFRKHVLYEFSGKGKIIFEENASITANFQVYQLNPGNLDGSLFFTTINSKLNNVINFDKTFRLDGGTVKGLKISAEGCGVYTTNIVQTDNLDYPLITARFHIGILKVYNVNLENSENEEATLCIEIGILNYYARTNFLINTEIGEIESSNRLSNDDINIFKNLHIPNNTSVLRLKVKGGNTIEATKEKLFKVVNRILELASFALRVELRWSYYTVFLNEFSDSQFIYYESISRLPVIPNTNYNVEESRIGEFINRSYDNYSDQLNEKYNFTLALKWYLDSMTSRYEVMRFISASTSLESILDSFSTESESVLPKKEFKELRNKLEFLVETEIGNKIPSDDLETMLKRIAEINRRSYRKKAERLLESLGILDDRRREALKEIIEVRDRITHSGRLVDPVDKKKTVKTYLELISILTKVFHKILIPDDNTFYQYAEPWKLVE